MKPALRHIMVSLGKSAPGDGGIFEFSSQLAQRFAAVAPEWAERDRVRFTFHVRPQLLGRFGDAVDHLPLVRLQRWLHTQPRRYALWHSLHQLNKFLPPRGCGPRVLTVHDLNYLYDRNAYSTWREQRRTRALFARTDEVVAISQHTAADVKKHLHWAGPLQVIYNGARNLRSHDKQALPGVDAGRPFLLHLSRMTPSKNPQAILDMARLWPEMQFLMCGAASLDAKALAAANTLPHVQFHLDISDAQKAWAYEHCAGFVFPSLTEGFGLPPIEAMHFGKPVFLSRRTCLPEIGGAAASYFDNFEPLAMRQTVERGIAAALDPAVPEAVRQHAAQFDWDRTAKAYLALYRRLLGLPATP